jgi:hypothetical protein
MEEEPAKFAVAAAEAALHLEWLSGIHSSLEYFQHSREVVRMNRNPPAPIQRLSRRQAGIVQPSLIEEFSGAVWTSGPCQRGDRIDYSSKLVFRVVHFERLVECRSSRFLVATPF